MKERILKAVGLTILSCSLVCFFRPDKVRIALETIVANGWIHVLMAIVFLGLVAWLTDKLFR